MSAHLKYEDEEITVEVFAADVAALIQKRLQDKTGKFLSKNAYSERFVI